GRAREEPNAVDGTGCAGVRGHARSHRAPAKSISYVQFYKDAHPNISSNRRRPPIDSQTMPSSKRRTITAQVQHRAGNFLDLANAPHRVHGGGELGLARVGFIRPAEH